MNSLKYKEKLPPFQKQFFKYKKVLLRECKTHTDRSISSTPYAVLSGGGGTLGYPFPLS